MHVHRFVLMCTMFSIAHTIHTVSLKPICSFFGGTPYEQIVDKDYTLTSEGVISLKNLHGSITVKTGLDKRSVAVKAIKHASDQEHLEHMHVIEEDIKSNHIVLRSAYAYEKIKGTIDYVLTIPEDANIHVSTDAGDITIKDIHGAARINTGTGDISMHNAQKHVEANVTQQGNITMIRPSQSIQLSSNKGTIRVIDSTDSVGARVKHGKVEVKCKTFPAGKQMKLATENGPIALHTPKHMHCALQARTKNGTVTSSRPITIDAHTTQLNKAYWQQVKQSVKGAIGDKKAKVTLFSTKGNIQILQY